MSKKEELPQKDTPLAAGAKKKGQTKKLAPVQAVGKAVAYIGPTFRGAAKGTVYNNGLPQALKEAIEAKPAISQLLVPVEGLPKANKSLADPDSALSRLYQVAEEHVKKGE